MPGVVGRRRALGGIERVAGRGKLGRNSYRTACGRSATPGTAAACANRQHARTSEATDEPAAGQRQSLDCHQTTAWSCEQWSGALGAMPGKFMSNAPHINRSKAALADAFPSNHASRARFFRLSRSCERLKDLNPALAADHAAIAPCPRRFAIAVMRLPDTHTIKPNSSRGLTLPSPGSVSSTRALQKLAIFFRMLHETGTSCQPRAFTEQWQGNVGLRESMPDEEVRRLPWQPK